MEPLTLTLIGYPLSVLANFTYDKLKNVSQKMDVNPLKDLFLISFFKSIEYHGKHYDDYSKEVTEKLRKSVEKDEDKLLLIFSRNSDNFDTFLSSIKNREFQETISKEIIVEYSLDSTKDQKIIVLIITDCLNYYLSAFFDQMNEKEGVQAILMECLKIDNIVDLLKQIDSQIVTKKDLDELRRIILLKHFNESAEAKKELEDYDEYLRNKFKYLELRGFSPKISGKEVQMELLDIFVPLEINLDKSIMPRVEFDTPILQQSLEISTSKRKENKDKDPLTSILKHRYLVILGDPGLGKSTLLKYLAVKVTKLRNNKDLFANIVPLYIRISDYADYFKKNKKTLYEFITEHYDKQYQHIFKEGFEFSNLLLLMDGLDEITDTPLRIKVTEQVMDLIARYPYNRYVATSRIVGYQESKLGSDFKHFKLMPFKQEQIKLFSEQWYKSIAQHTDNDMENAIEQADSLYSSIFRSPSVIRLATNPLLMTIIAMIHYKGKKLPNKRVELYDISTETFLEYWVQLRTADGSQLKDKSEIIEILAPIAFEIHQTKSNALIEEKEFEHTFLLNFKSIHTNTPDENAKRECKEFISFLRQQAGFFYEKGVDDEGNRFYGFIHLTFEEYLAAIEFISKWNEGELDLKEYVFDPRWTEIIRLAASQLRLSFKGRTGRLQSTKFVEDILSIDDPFPEAHRRLHLVCLILSDDVSITDELLNEILDKIIEEFSQNGFEELVISFSKLFKEILYSEYRDEFIARFEKEVVTDNLTLLNNLVYILISNSHDREIDKFMQSMFIENEDIFKATYQMKWNNYPFQNTKVYKENFIKYLSDMKSQNDDGFKKTIDNFFQMEFMDEFNWDEEEIIDILNQFHDTNFFDDLLTYIIDRLLYEILLREQSDLLDQLLQEYSGNVRIKNLEKSISLLDFARPFFESAQISTFEIEHYKASIIIFDDEYIKVIFWHQSYDDIFIHSISVTGIQIYLNDLKSKFSESDIKIIEINIYSILGYDKIDTIESTSRFIEAHRTGFMHWGLFPFYNIASNPSELSKIIVQYGHHYTKIAMNMNRNYFKNEISLELFDNEHISPPAKLLTYYFMKKPFGQKLLEESIDYYRKCSPEEKKGAFSILYSVLNHFELT